MTETVPSAKPQGRDPAAAAAALEEWLAPRLGPRSDPRVTIEVGSGATGISSETLLFDVQWDDGGAARAERLAARLEPDDPFPVFPGYDMELQFRCLDVVERHTPVPVPSPRWFEPDPGPLGAPFFVMSRVDGAVPPDLPPYTFEGWVLDLPSADQDRLWRASIDVLAGVHSIDPDAVDLGFLDRGGAGDDDLDRYLDREQRYFEWAADTARYPTISAAFDWLREHRPEDPGPSVMNWGDARLGNIVYRGTEPVAVLDWEMAALGPREVDLGWSLFMHAFFVDVAETLGLDPQVAFADRTETVAHYERRAGVGVRDVEWYEIFAGTRFAAISTRTNARMWASGEAVEPDDPETACYPLPLLRRRLGL